MNVFLLSIEVFILEKKTGLHKDYIINMRWKVYFMQQWIWESSTFSFSEQISVPSAPCKNKFLIKIYRMILISKIEIWILHQFAMRMMSEEC